MRKTHNKMSPLLKKAETNTTFISAFYISVSYTHLDVYKRQTLMCDAQIYPIIPVKKEVKATISGIYITGVKGLRGPLETPEKKKGFFARLRNK